MGEHKPYVDPNKPPAAPGRWPDGGVWRQEELEHRYWRRRWAQVQVLSPHEPRQLGRSRIGDFLGRFYDGWMNKPWALKLRYFNERSFLNPVGTLKVGTMFFLAYFFVNAMKMDDVQEKFLVNPYHRLWSSVAYFPGEACSDDLIPNYKEMEREYHYQSQGSTIKKPSW